MKGPTIRRGARVGGGVILCPGVEIGEEAFIGAGAVVTKDVPPRKIVYGNPARVHGDVRPSSCSTPSTRFLTSESRYTTGSCDGAISFASR